MSKQYQNKVLNKPLILLCHQVIQRPQFSYISPLKIIDDNFPEDLKDLFYTDSYSIKIQGQTQDEQDYYDISNIRQVAGLKFNKATFVKMKHKNYTKYYKTIMNCIGKGSFGTVRKVQSLISRQYRAAKILRKNTMKQNELQKLLAEVYIMMQLDHPNIANILEVFNFDNEFTLICQLCEGGDLLNFAKSSKKRNQQKFVAIIIKQLLRIVIYLHNIGMIHRDIKPQNILFQTNDSHNIKLIDFGIATKIDSNQILSQRIGTPAYMAPQIIFQKYNEKVDVWAIGVTMYHLISGKLPFKGQTIKDVMRQIVKGQVQFPGQIWKQISPQCIQVINLMTLKDFQKRPSAKQLFQHSYFQNVKELDLSANQKNEFASNLRKCQFKNKLQAAIQTFIASQLLSTQEKNELVNFFRQFDKDNDGVINTEELRSALQHRKKISAQRIDILMNAIDTNGSGKIDYTQFLAAGFLDAKSFTTERLKQAFAHFDTNGNGRISFAEVMEFMSDFGESKEQVDKIFTEFDTNCDGSISEDEFISLMLERSKNINLSKLKESNLPNQYEKRLTPGLLDNKCFSLTLTRDHKSVNFQNLKKSKITKKLI